MKLALAHIMIEVWRGARTVAGVEPAGWVPGGRQAGMRWICERVEQDCGRPDLDRHDHRDREGHRRRAAALGAVLLAGLAVGCAGPGGAAPPAAPPPSATGASATGASATGPAAAVAPTIPDSVIAERIEDAFDRAGLSGADLTVREGRVLLTGRVPTPDARVEAVRLAWQADGVDEVINELVIDEESSLSDAAADAVIATRLRSRLLFDGDIIARRYSIDVVDGIVYLSGRAGSQAELDRVLAHVREVPRVRRVVNHVRF